MPKKLLLDPERGSSFLDLNADCRPDMLLISINEKSTKRYFETYLYTDYGYCLIDVSEVPLTFSMPSFMDINKRGTNDLVLIDNTSKGLFVHINKNFFYTNITSNMDDLCLRNKSVAIPFQHLSSTEIGSSSKIIQKLDIPQDYKLYEIKDFPAILHIMDIDMDGDRDIIITVTNSKDKKKENSKVFGLKNKVCNESIISEIYPKGATQNESETCRYFNAKGFSQEFKIFEQYSIPHMSTIDFDETGFLSFMASIYDPNTKKFQIKTFFNF